MCKNPMLATFNDVTTRNLHSMGRVEHDKKREVYTLELKTPSVQVSQEHYYQKVKS